MSVINYAEFCIEMIITCAGEAVSGVRGPLPLEEPDDDEHDEDEDKEGHGEADVEGEVRGRDLTLVSLVIAVEDGEVMTRGHQGKTARAGAVAAEDVLALAVPASIGGCGGGAGPPSELEAVHRAGGPGGPGGPVTMNRGTHLGAGLLLYRSTITPGASVNRFWAVTGPLPLLEAAPTILVIALGPL